MDLSPRSPLDCWPEKLKDDFEKDFEKYTSDPIPSPVLCQNQFAEYTDGATPSLVLCDVAGDESIPIPCNTDSKTHIQCHTNNSHNLEICHNQVQRCKAFTATEYTIIVSSANKKWNTQFPSVHLMTKKVEDEDSKCAELLDGISCKWESSTSGTLAMGSVTIHEHSNYKSRLFRIRVQDCESFAITPWFFVYAKYARKK